MGVKCPQGCTCRKHSRPREVYDRIAAKLRGQGDVRSPEGKAQHARKMAEYYADPEYQMMRSKIAAQKVDQGGAHVPWFTVRNLEGSEFKVQGSWERKFVEFCNTEEIVCRRFDRDHVVYYEYEGKPHHYGPDFYLPELDIYVEVKGQLTPRQQVKIDAFRATGKRLEVLGWDELRFEPNRILILAHLGTGSH